MRARTGCWPRCTPASIGTPVSSRRWPGSRRIWAGCARTPESFGACRSEVWRDVHAELARRLRDEFGQLVHGTPDGAPSPFGAGGLGEHWWAQRAEQRFEAVARTAAQAAVAHEARARLTAGTAAAAAGRYRSTLVPDDDGAGETFRQAGTAARIPHRASPTPSPPPRPPRPPRLSGSISATRRPDWIPATPGPRSTSASTGRSRPASRWRQGSNTP